MEVSTHAMLMVAVLAGCRKALVGTGWGISLLFSTKGWSFAFVGAPFLAPYAVVSNALTGSYRTYHTTKTTKYFSTT